MSSTQQQAEQTSWRRSVGQRLRVTRVGKGYTQIRLAREMNISNVLLSTLETGEARNHQTLTDHVKHICTVLKVDPTWVLTGEKKPGSFIPEQVLAIPTTVPAIVHTQTLNIGALQRAGRKIRAGRNAMGLTQAEFAAMVHTKPGTLSAIERGYSKTHFELHAVLCCEVLGVSYNWLFELENGLPADPVGESIPEQLGRLERKMDLIIRHFNIQQ